jgi:hypothetical protein
MLMTTKSLNPVPAHLAPSIPRRLVDPPSLGDTCPRTFCGQQMITTPCDDFEVMSCTCGYTVKVISGELKARYAERLRVSTSAVLMEVRG